MKRPADDTHDATKRFKTLTHPFRTHSADPNKKRTLSDDTPDASIKRQRSNQVEESKQSQTATSNLDLTDEATTIPGDETEPFDDISIRIHLDEQAKSQHIIARNKHQVNDETRSKTPKFEAMKTRTTTPAALFQDMEAQTTSNTPKTATSLTSDGHLFSLNERSSASEENPKRAIKSTSCQTLENRRVMFSTATTYLFEWDAACKHPTLARRHVRENTKTLKYVKFSTATTYVFERVLGGGAVANGPALGLARRHCEECTVDICKTDDKPKGKPVELNYKQRYSILKKAGVPFQDMVAYCQESSEILKARKAIEQDIRRQERINAYYLAQHKVVTFNQRLRNGEEDMMF